LVEFEASSMNLNQSCRSFAVLPPPLDFGV
jgi:hypothetical protein